MLTLRPFTFSPSDYETINRINNQIWLDNRSTVDSLKRGDDTAPFTKENWLRVIVEWSGTAVGYGIHFPAFWHDIPNQYYVSFQTMPAYRKRGLATAYVHQFLQPFLATRPVSSLIAKTRTDQPEGVQFLENRGFELQLRRTRTLLYLDQVDLNQFTTLRNKIKQKGIQISPLSKLMQSDPDYAQKLWDLEWILLQDEPHAETPKRKSLTEFIDKYINSPDFLPEGWFVAMHNKQLVGWSALLNNLNQPETMNTGITVIARAYRRIGLATTLKVTAFEYAKQLGKKVIEATNSETNPMLELNLKLGFQPVYSWLEYKKVWAQP